MSLTPEQAAVYIQLLNGLATLATNAVNNYTTARQLATSAGVSDADMAAADARFAKVYPDPLAGTST